MIWNIKYIFFTLLQFFQLFGLCNVASVHKKRRGGSCKFLLKREIYLTFNSIILPYLSVTSAVNLPCPPSSELTSRGGWGRSSSVITHKSSTPCRATASNRSEVIHWQHVLFENCLFVTWLIMLCCRIVRICCGSLLLKFEGILYWWIEILHEFGNTCS